MENKKTFADRAIERLDKVVNAKYSVPTWIVALESTIFGFFYTLYFFAGEIGVLANAIPFFGILWGPALLVFGVLSLIGMAKHNSLMVKRSAFVNAIIWVGGTTAFILTPQGWTNAIIFGLPMLVFWAYKYLAAEFRERKQL